MPSVSANAITIEYDTFGDPSSPPVLLIMGFGAQMTLWDPAFCQAIVDEGFYVIRYDNRDVGKSTWLTEVGEPDVAAIMSGTSPLPYSMSDMAADGAGLLSALDIASAHIVGASMGGMIAQTFAIEYPERTRTLTSIMSTTGNTAVGQPTPTSLAALTAPPATTRDEAIDMSVTISQIIGSPAYPADEADIRERAGAAYDRAVNPAGRTRQLAAILLQPDRTEALGSLTMPTLVIHGAADPLVDRSGGEATAAAIPNAQLKMIPGMGHDLPNQLQDEIVADLTKLFADA